MFERALALAPRSIEVQTELGLALANRVVSGMSNSRAADIARAKELIEQSLATSPGNTPAHMAKAYS